MIVKSGRKYIIEHGFKTDSITKIIFGDSDAVSNENDTKTNLGNTKFNDNDILLTTIEDKDDDAFYFTCQYEKKKDEENKEVDIDIETVFKYNIHLPKTASGNPEKISCMGLFNNDDTLIARVVFPPIYKKNNTELKLEYTLYF